MHEPDQSIFLLGKKIKMKSSVLFVCFLEIFVAGPAQAVDARSCAAKAARLKHPEHSAYMKSCLAQVSSTANVREAELRHKRALCAQNAKNYKLQGSNRENYIMTCINRNEAETAAKVVHNQIDASKKAGRLTFAQAGAANPKAKPRAARSKKRKTTK